MKQAYVFHVTLSSMIFICSSLSIFLLLLWQGGYLLMLLFLWTFLNGNGYMAGCYLSLLPMLGCFVPRAGRRVFVVSATRQELSTQLFDSTWKVYYLILKKVSNRVCYTECAIRLAFCNIIVSYSCASIIYIICWDKHLWYAMLIVCYMSRSQK